jgi:hypothetical protein
VKIGIVGADKNKFSWTTELFARCVCKAILVSTKATEVVSGACPKGGVDIWAVDEGRGLGLKVTEFPPANPSWYKGYRARNLRIAHYADEVYCVTVEEMPIDKNAKIFGCIHCSSKSHVQSGGCWTTRRAKMLGKKTGVYIICNDGTFHFEEQTDEKPKYDRTLQKMTARDYLGRNQSK